MSQHDTEGGPDTPSGEVIAPSRRAFLAGAAGLTGVALTSGAWRAPAFAAPATGGGTPGFVAAGAGVAIDLTLEGSDGHSFPLGFDTSLSADVLPEDETKGDTTARKRPGRVKYGDITMKVGTGMSKHFYSWVKDSFDHKTNPRTGALAYGRRNGAIIACDFRNALITEIGMPALDAASKDAAKMTIKLSPEASRFRRASSMASPPNAKTQKQWLPANFRLSLGDLPCSRVNKIESLTVKQSVIVDDTGTQREPIRVPGKIEFPNLTVHLPEADAGPWLAWFEDFVIKGNNDDSKQKNGQLTYLATDGSPLFVLDFTGAGIVGFAPDNVEAGSDQIRRVKAEMYLEKIAFDYHIKL